MAMKNKSFNNIRSYRSYTSESASTYKANNANVVVGSCVTIVGNETVGLGADGDPLTGLVSVQAANGNVTVEERGVHDIETTTLLTVGLKTLVVDGTGKAKVGNGGLQCRIRATWTEGAQHFARVDLG